MLLYCSAYYVVSNRFFKKGCELFSSFFLISFHTMCVSSLLNLTSCPLPPLNHNSVLKDKTWINRQFDQSVISHRPLFGWQQYDGDSNVLFYFILFYFLHTEQTAYPQTCRVQLICFTVDVSTPCKSNFGDFNFHISCLFLNCCSYCWYKNSQNIWSHETLFITHWIDSKRNDFKLNTVS